MPGSDVPEAPVSAKTSAADAKAAAEIARLREQLEAAGKPDKQPVPDPVRLKVESPHSSVTFGGVTVGSEYTEVPGHAVAALMEGAADAGVTITQDQES
jgi:hypothetical protein